MDTETTRIFEELCFATRILAGEGILDGFGHVSARHPRHGDRYYLVRDNAAEPGDAGNFMELDLESNPIAKDCANPSIERFLHGEIYKARSDVNAIVHTHAPALIPFGVSKTQLQPLYHMCGFLAYGVPVFDIRQDNGMTDMLITSQELGFSLARCLDKSALVLMRGHGATVVGASVKEAVFRAIYATLNAQAQPVAMQLGNPTYLCAQEAFLADDLHRSVMHRPWKFLVRKWCDNE
ncbi:class II aldolase/adducin family protein [Solidesulfovibrio fructosivorans JJ]]|uniref:Class II aldolase/adducin family protein n=1 Tax=Solidesulfovibrio fructosivorans JJ] TaxID=596151 RepID=E1JZB3_SOLFR|nr:class II aldolase/adducin family protein [Solidesulfovibrio fructosivorans]EFL50273.1 class II aldolase/adducin family protein [Solidesulfovibrio fructosivorans JJ]]